MAVSYYLKFGKPDAKGGEIVGSSKDPKHPHWVELDSLQWSMGRRRLGRTKREDTGATTLTEMSLTSGDAAAMAKIMYACAVGTGFETVTIDAMKDDTLYMQITMTKAFISSCQLGGGRGDGKPFVAFVLEAEKIAFATRDVPPPGQTPKYGGTSSYESKY